ncbi:MAG: hypothetical protein K6V73_07125 [Firmicutes bacterium]|nr:hypothetical protein [Bacillota bacterium]
MRTFLERDLGGTGIGVAVGRSNQGDATWYRAQILATAGALDYYPNVAAPRLWVRLHLSGRLRADLVFSFHAVGTHPRGAMACVAFTSIPLERGPEGEPQWRSDPACAEPFAFSHGTDPEAVSPEFIAWVDRAVQVGLETVRRYL